MFLSVKIDENINNVKRKVVIEKSLWVVVKK